MIQSIKVDFLGGEAERKSRRSTTVIAVLFSILVGILSSIGAGASYRAATNGTNILTEVGNLPIIADIRRLTWGESSDILDATLDDRLSILILGVGGVGHDGSELTDTILLSTADLKTQKVGMLSIPRDVAYPLGGGRFIKINAVNAYAEQKNPGQGARETADAFEELLGTNIDHVIKINFKAFEDLINAIGGVDVAVEASFVDYEYPTEDDKWQTINFKEGSEHMDGARALMYARSRHGSNGEGSDFARSRRQQIIILAVKKKLLSMGTLTNPSKLLKLYQAISSNIQTDLTPWEIMKLAPLAKQFSSENITMRVLTNEQDGELVNQIVNGAYMLFPKKQDWSEIRNIAQHPFGDESEADDTTLGTKTDSEPARIEIRNGTFISGLASQASEQLKAKGFAIAGLGNASHRTYEKTVIYDLTNGKRLNDLETLKKLLHADVESVPSFWNTGASAVDDAEPKPNNPTQTDFLIILGSK
jgi:LCP family protein required for cell wall assembly